MDIENFFDERKLQILHAWISITSTLWFRPGLWMLLSIILATLLVTIDNAVLIDDFWDWAPWFLRGNASGARTMLGSISSAMLTVASLAFSLMMLTVVQTANAYSPRIINQFLSDSRNQNVLGILLGTYLYSLLVLRAVTDSFVPLLAVNVSIIIAVFATVALVSFISHVAQSLKVSYVSQLIMEQTISVINEKFPDDMGQAWSSSTLPERPDPGGQIYAASSGYLQLTNGDEQLMLAKEADVTIQILHKLGDYILEGVPLAEVWPAERLEQELADKLRNTLVVGKERTETQDIGFGVRQLVDIALRALSPGINDPTTATNMINTLNRILAAKLRVGEISNLRADEQDTLRVILALHTFEILLNEAFLEILHYGASDFTIGRQLVTVVEQLSYVATEPSHKETLGQFLSRIVVVVRQEIESDVELELFDEAVQKIR